MRKLFRPTPDENSAARAWYIAWATALAVLGVSSALRWFVLASSDPAQTVAEIVQIGAVTVAIVAVLRWAALHER
jgi:hypothetical protein